MAKIPAALMAATLVFLLVSPAGAHARLIAVFPLLSTQPLAGDAADASKAIAQRLASYDGYDARLLPDPKGQGLRAAAASAGAEIYVTGQLVVADGGYEISLGSFAVATDKPIGEYHVVVKTASILPEDPPLLSLAAPAKVIQPPEGGAAVEGVVVPTGTPVDLSLDAPVSSGSAKVGDKFTFKVLSAVLVGDTVVVRKDAEGEGEVTVAEPAGGNGHAGKLGLQFDWVASVDGSKIALSDTEHSDEGEQKKGAASTATIASYLILGPLGLFAHNFVKGRDLVVDGKTKLRAYVDHTVHVASDVKESIAPGFAR